MKTKKYGILTKTVAVAFAALGMAGIIAACGNDDDEDDTTQITDPAPTTAAPAPATTAPAPATTAPPEVVG